MNKNRQGTDTINSVASMLLFLLFTVCALMLVYTGAGTYGRIATGFDDTFSSTVTIRYVTNKLHSSTSASVTEVDGASAITVSEVYGESEYTTTIYCYNGTVYEFTSDAGTKVKLGDGNEVLSAQNLEFEEVADNLVKITVKDKDDRESVSYVNIQ